MWGNVKDSTVSTNKRCQLYTGNFRNQQGHTAHIGQHPYTLPLKLGNTPSDNKKIKRNFNESKAVVTLPNEWMVKNTGYKHKHEA
jgi:hypothetical protein